MKKNINYLLVIIFLALACSENNTNETTFQTPTNQSNNPTGDWLVPIGDVKDGGPGKDGIPSIDNPKFIEVNNATYLEDSDLVIGISVSGETRAYPHRILDLHEVINDNVDANPITISYCPLTGTAFAWESFTDGEKTTFGVSGLLYKSNLIVYDRNTDSNWSQLDLKCINGSLINETPKIINIIETTWKTWKSLYPNSKVLSTDTGFSRNYDFYPYGNYKTEHSYFLFSPIIFNNALPNKQRVYAIIDEGKSKVYQFSSFGQGKTIRDSFNQKEYLIVGNENIINSFEITEEYSNLTFQYDYNNLGEAFFKDNQGNQWNVFGEVIFGPKKGTKLNQPKSVNSYWFAIAAFYPDTEIY